MPYYIEQTGQTLPLDKAFSVNGISYPATYLRLAPQEDKAAAGIVWKDAPELQFKDSRYYDNHVAPDGTVTSTPKDVEMLKANMVSEAKRTANTLLAGSDWQVIASVERSRVVDEPWATYRADVVAECARQETAIEAAADIEALLEVGEKVSGGITGVITGRALYEGTLDLAEAIALTKTYQGH